MTCPSRTAPPHPQTLIESKVCYVDTLGFRTDHALAIGERKRLHDLCGNAYEKRYRKPLQARIGGRFRTLPWRCNLHQPSRAALEELCELACRRHIFINRIDFALDYLTGSPIDARRIWEFLDTHLVQRWHGAEDVMYFCGTRYTRRRRRDSRQLVMYADKNAAEKQSGTPNCHLELRAMGRRQVKSLGIEDPWDLLDFDYDALWSRFLVLEEPRWTQIGRQSRGRGRAKKPDLVQYREHHPLMDRDRRAGEVIRRAAASSMRGATAQDARDFLSGAWWFQAASGMRLLPTDGLLPGDDPSDIERKTPVSPSTRPQAQNTQL